MQGTRIQVAAVSGLARELSFDAKKLAGHYSWPLWRAESVLAYIRAHEAELEKEETDLDHAGPHVLRRKLPRLEEFTG